MVLKLDDNRHVAPLKPIVENLTAKREIFQYVVRPILQKAHEIQALLANAECAEDEIEDVVSRSGAGNGIERP